MGSNQPKMQYSFFSLHLANHNQYQDCEQIVLIFLYLN